MAARRELGRLESQSSAQTEALGELLGRALPGGVLLALEGELGSGKTCFVRGLARGLGVSEGISSPTFALQHVHAGRLELWHFDAWRVGPAAGLLADLGPAELGRGAVVAVEWASRVAELLPEPRLEIALEHVDGGRRLNFCWVASDREPAEPPDWLLRLAAESFEPPATTRVGTATTVAPPTDPERP